MGSLPSGENHEQKLSVSHAEYRVVWEDVCERTPPCVDLLFEPMDVLTQEERWPRHLCYAAFQRQSTEAWAGKCVSVVTQAATRRWMSLHPLPIGRKAILARSQLLVGSAEGGVKGLEELLNIVPFDGDEEAIWALRIERRHSATVHTLDMFALIERKGTPVAGALAFSIHGRDRFTDLLNHAERWWHPWYGRPLQGRPKGSGRWSSREHFESALRQAVARTRSAGDKVKQETVAPRLYPSYLSDPARQLRADVETHGMKWRQDILRG
jgi:hypothetical protein